MGVTAGAVVALICAPQSGAKTRKQLKRKLNDAGDYVKDQIEDAGEYLRDQASTLGEQAGKVYNRGKSAADDYSVDDLKGAVKNAKSMVS